MEYEVFDNVWDAIEDDPGERECLKLRSLLMFELEREIKRKKWTRARAAKAFGITQLRTSKLMHGKINDFSLDLLVKMAAPAGFRVAMKLKKAA